MGYTSSMSLSKKDHAAIRNLVVDGTMEALNATVNPRFDQVESHLDEHDDRFGAIETRLARMEADIKAIQIDTRQVKSTSGKLIDHVEAPEADVKELYGMVAAIQKGSEPYRKFAKLPVEQKVLKLYDDFQLLAKEAGISLPR